MALIQNSVVLQWHSEVNLKAEKIRKESVAYNIQQSTSTTRYGKATAPDRTTFHNHVME
jgi:hypothetical protein